MKRLRFLLSFVVVVCATSAFAAETRRYLVATRMPVRAEHVRARFGGEREILPFRVVNGFAAELTESEVAELRASSDVLFIERDVERHAFGLSPTVSGRPIRTAAATKQTTPFGIELVNAPQVWPVALGGAVRVAVIDTGIDRNHPDIGPQYRGGRDLVNNDDDPQDDNGHGTHVAGTIAALDNDFGVLGVAPDVELFAVKVLNAAGNGSASGVVRAIDWAIENKMNVVNLSLGSDEFSVLEEQAFQRAADAGILAVAASGNDYPNQQTLSYPGAYETVISVGAIDENLKVASFSQRGAGLKVVAPGVGTLSTVLPTTSDIATVSTEGNPDVRGFPMDLSPKRDFSGAYEFCRFGGPSDFPSNMSGKIALIERGGTGADGLTYTFAQKVTNARAAGAVGVIVYNHSSGSFTGTLGSPSPAWLPAISVTRQDGTDFLALPAGTRISIHYTQEPGEEYAVFQGTSMATPHVSGVAALIWSLAPDASAALVRDALLLTAKDIGEPGYDTTFGNGLVDAFAAAKRLAPERFVPSSPKSRRRSSKRGG